jgi:hypothetical protein
MSGPRPIQGGQYEPFRKYFGVQGYIQPQLIDDIFAVFDMLNPPPEFLYPLGWQRQWSQIAVPAAGAGQYGVFTIKNPTPDRIVVVETIESLDSPGPTFFEYTADAAAAGQDGVPLDTRDTALYFATFARVCATTSGNAPTGNRIQGFNTAVPKPHNLIIGPGGTYSLKKLTANSAMSVVVTWRERKLDATETVR